MYRKPQAKKKPSAQEKRAEYEKNLDSSRSALDRVRRMSVRRKGRPSAKMGDLHLRRYGIGGRASQRLRQGLKRSSNKKSRHDARSWLRRWQ